jgi:hypothetical protein
MRRIALVLVVCLVAASAVSAQGIKFGVGAFGGMHIPVVQDGEKAGSIFGFKARWALGTFLTVEPTISFSKYGADEVEGFDYDIDGSTITAYGVDVTLGNTPGQLGIMPYFVLGAGFYKQKNDALEAFDNVATKVGWSGGLGLGFGFSPKFALDVRGKVHVASAVEGGSFKSASITGGLNYNFGSAY